MNELIDRSAWMMQAPNNWPNWPILTVIERGGSRRAGIMIESRTPKVYVGVLMWDLQTGPLIPQLETKMTELKTYESFEECAQEWRVD